MKLKNSKALVTVWIEKWNTWSEPHLTIRVMSLSGIYSALPHLLHIPLFDSLDYCLIIKLKFVLCSVFFAFSIASHVFFSWWELCSSENDQILPQQHQYPHNILRRFGTLVVENWLWPCKIGKPISSIFCSASCRAIQLNISDWCL